MFGRVVQRDVLTRAAEMYATLSSGTADRLSRKLVRKRTALQHLPAMRLRATLRASSSTNGVSPACARPGSPNGAFPGLLRVKRGCRRLRTEIVRKVLKRLRGRSGSFFSAVAGQRATPLNSRTEIDNAKSHVSRLVSYHSGLARSTSSTVLCRISWVFRLITLRPTPHCWLLFILLE